MAKILMVKPSCTNHYYLTTAAILSPPKAALSLSKSMATCSSFCPQRPIQFRRKPISCLPIKPQFSVQVKAFSSQESSAPPKDEIPARVGFLGLGIMGSPMAQNLIKAGLQFQAQKSQLKMDSDKSLYETAAPLLDIMGKSRFYLGDVGNGAAMKLVVNMIMGSMMASFSEGLLLSEKVGLDPKVLVEVISQGAISVLYETSMDLRLALGLAESVSQSTPIAAAANELYKVAKAHGLSEDDFSAVIEALKVKLQERS
ncbi:UNVERIFIED_CONTAM: Glyoxylate/succinic semialdehyde reductase 2, chloroplastic [Sesamum radiatum]|uniref:Glyoxylate/succinic semialdehyde reductase 2, chloroplastic n=1 Tax=Sesamum radiatum TaxID=300843 RepID=A0AAW2VMC0_SESRA